MPIRRDGSSVPLSRRTRARGTLLAMMAALALLLVAPRGAIAAATPFEDSRMIIEFNSSAQDIGIQFFIDSEGAKSVDIFSPAGDKVYSVQAKGRLLSQGGASEMFVESAEPTLSELPLSKFFTRFPAGKYKFVGVAPDGSPIQGTATFNHRIPKGPTINEPVTGASKCAKSVAIPAVIGWDPVTQGINGQPITIVGYEVIVENSEVFDVHLPGDATQLTISAEFLEPKTDYIFEVLAIADGGNQTITEGCFSTAP